MQHLAGQMPGVRVVYKGQTVGRMLSAEAQENALRVVIELDNPTVLPDIETLQFRATPKDPKAAIGSSLTVHAVEIKTKG